LTIVLKREISLSVDLKEMSERIAVTDLHRAPFAELKKQHGLGDAAALVSCEMSALEQEHLRVILLDRRNRVMETVEVYEGSANSSQMRLGEIFKEAVRKNASASVVIPNHPSGDSTPSPDDVAVTRAIVQAGKLLGVEVLDHLVVGQGKWVSLGERGLDFA
jgi:DNA repair protein RadC